MRPRQRGNVTPERARSQHELDYNDFWPVNPGSTMKEIPAFKLIAEPMTEEARALPKFESAASEVGTRHRLGGEPSRRIDPAHWPKCADCGDKMSFYGQLDSINDEFC